MSRGKDTIAQTPNHASLIIIGFLRCPRSSTKSYPSVVSSDNEQLKPFMMFTSMNGCGSMTIARFRSPVYLQYQYLPVLFTATTNQKTPDQEAEKVLRRWSPCICSFWVFHYEVPAPSSHDLCNSPSHPCSCARPPGFHLGGHWSHGKFPGKSGFLLGRFGSKRNEGKDVRVFLWPIFRTI